MTIYYVTTGPWGTGTGAPISAAQVDGNFHDVDQRIVGLAADLDIGKSIDSITSDANSMTVHFTDGTFQVIPLPIAEITYVGQWTNGTPYTRGQMVSVPGLGMFQVLEDHTTPLTPAPFDPNATDETTDQNPLYLFWMPLYDTTYDAMIFVPGVIQRDGGELLFQGVVTRPIRLLSGDAHCHAYLDVGNDSSGATDIVLTIEKNRIEIGTITFAANGDIDADGGQEGAFVINATVNFVDGDNYAIRVVQSNNAEAAGLSVTLPFMRTDI
jgi:hypothetical protein